MISQSRYVDVKSNILAVNGGLPQMAALVITSAAMVTGAANKTEYDSGKPVYLTKNDITLQFAEDDNIVKFANKFFAYISPNGDAPNGLYVAKKLSGDTSYVKTFGPIAAGVTDFRTFAVIDDVTDSVIKEVADAVKGIDNHTYRFVFETTDYTKFYPTGDKEWAGQDLSGYEHTTAVVIADSDSAKFDMAITMAICAATDYELTGSVPTQFARQLAGSVGSVDTDEMAATLDAAKFNYFGTTKGYGNTITFYQRGVNLDGTDTAITDNECWLRKNIISRILGLMVGSNRIPANDIGSSMISGVITEVADKAIDNGTIIPKRLSSAQRAVVRQLAGFDAAVTEVESVGYYISVTIDVDMVAHFRLIYSKGDAIRKVEGANSLA